MKPNPPLKGFDPRRPAFLVLEKDDNWATYDLTRSGKKALLVFTTPENAAQFYKVQGRGPAQAVEILAKGVQSVIDLCRRKGVEEFVADLEPEGVMPQGEPISDLSRYRRA